MKKLITTALLSLLCFIALAQSPQSFEYQAVVRDASGNILVSQAVGVQITLKQGSTSGTNVYQETFSSTTNLYGLVNLQIGTGTTGDDFNTIDWANGPYFVEVALDVTGGTSYSVMGTSQLLSVPYALHAKTVETYDACSLFNYYYADRDGDGFGDSYNLVFACTQPTGYVTDNTDCNDNNSNSNPNATEICDNIDNNCDGQIDEGITLVLQYIDSDGDGYGDYNSPPSYFCTLEPGFSLTNDDCNDMDGSTNPGATEICGDGIDNDCDGTQDNGCCQYKYYLDFDLDGYGDENNSIISTLPTPPNGYVLIALDCDDNNNTIHPMTTEINGDGIDNDCWGGENVAASSVDTDNDGITDDYDCAPNDGNVYPGAIEACGAGVDINCDSFIPTYN
ncbi:MAG: putative metal-binding motif-containing protein [Flavobacteriales bacterium]|nr:putative metal-binding motif-containing protein [Flavobacteriales bacterium]